LDRLQHLVKLHLARESNGTLPLLNLRKFSNLYRYLFSRRKYFPSPVNLTVISKELLFFKRFRRVAFSKFIECPQFLGSKFAVILLLESVVGVEEVVGAQGGVGETVDYRILGLLDPGIDTIFHVPKVVQGRLLQVPGFEFDVSGKSESFEQTLQISFRKQHSAGEVEVVFSDAVVAASSLLVVAVLCYAKLSNFLAVLAPVHLII
jgi:catabolite regulation protein CreA